MSDDGERTDRRKALQAIGAAGAFGLAGCIGGGSGSEDPGVETEDPTPAGTGTPTATPTGTETTTSTPTRTAASGPKPIASVQVEEEGDEITVLLVSLGDDASRVELGGCGGGETLPTVGDEATVSGCEQGDPLRIFAVDDDDGNRALVGRYPREPDSGGGACDGDGGGGPTAAITVDRNPDREPDAAVTLVSLGEGTHGIRLRGCADSEIASKVGESVPVTGCSEGEVAEVVVVGCDGTTELIREIEV
jgi:hypothetical protein